MTENNQNEISAAQCRAARALLGWSQGQLSDASRVSRATLAEFEQGKRVPYERTLRDIEAALTAAGIIFESDGEMITGGPGVRLAKQQDEGIRPDKLTSENDG
ncbi:MULTISPECIES: helix-turn-helix transcriptional regulator [unclassified Chelatococcus]|uniref:helix-turn-helix domain-containing protein n=1 Tax=unclassified Chelatococcus TaxID=2638111 RepID=UPI001BCE3AD8|nr:MULTISPECIES: helix-turn-helix transcriptional regulator [unclassified Chelatococcus]MBS7696225.1 helix-turn-helix transcriptional regulator [Chelatococcus sp. YT9]MBX3557748.1 helix-turn-helix transcriptional regulator [Chelatococcus sp.]